MFDITRRSATRLTRLATPAERIPYVSAPADAWQRLDRWLAQPDESRDDAAVRACLAEDGPRTVRRIVEVSSLGRTPSNAPAIRALALAASLGNAATREMALEAVPEVARSVAEYLAFARAVTAE